MRPLCQHGGVRRDRHSPPPTGVAIQRRSSCEPYEARWLLGPLLGTFAVALGLIAVSQLAAFFVWALGSVATIAVARWHEARYEATHPRAALPSAAMVPRRRPER